MNCIDANKTHATYIEQKGNDQLVITHLQNMSHIMEFNYNAKKNSNAIWGRGDKHIKFIGRVPISRYKEWMEDGIAQDDKALKSALELEFSGALKGTKKRL